MEGKRAYLTPGPETAQKLSASFLYGNKDEINEIKFSVDNSDSGPVDIEDIVLSPIERVCVTSDGYEITGYRSVTPKILGKLIVDKTVDPPLAIYIEEEPKD